MMPPMKLTDGIYKVDRVGISNAYLVVTDEGLVAVDTGMPGNAARICSYIEGLGRPATDLRLIVLTHCDIDHIGSAARLKQLTGAAVAVHELDGPVVAGRSKPVKGGRVMAALYRLLRFKPVEPDLLLRDGQTIAGLRVVHVPGHTPGSIVLTRGDGVVFSGDALLGDGKGRIRPPDPRLAFDRAQAQLSAGRIRALPMTLLLPGHGQPVHD